jgi:hypothetical protein
MHRRISPTRCSKAASPVRELVTACLLCSYIKCASATQVATNEGLMLSFGPGGTVVSCRIDNRELLRTGAKGGMFVADVKDITAREEVLGPNPSFEQIEARHPVGWDVGHECW